MYLFSLDLMNYRNCQGFIIHGYYRGKTRLCNLETEQVEISNGVPD